MLGREFIVFLPLGFHIYDEKRLTFQHLPETVSSIKSPYHLRKDHWNAAVMQ